MSASLKETHKGLLLFVAYSVLSVVYDLIRFLQWWPFANTPLTTRSYWPVSICYVNALVLLFSFWLSERLPAEWTLRRKGASRLPIIVCSLMGVEMLRGLLFWILSVKRHNQLERQEFFVFLFVSVLIPSLWIKVWLSRSVKAYLNRSVDQNGHERI